MKGDTRSLDFGPHVHVGSEAPLRGASVCKSQNRGLLAFWNRKTGYGLGLQDS